MKMNKITELKENQIFVFGSNGNGNHAGGAALQALTEFGAINGVARGLQGKSYAIETLDKEMNKVSLDCIKDQLVSLIDFALCNPDKEYLVTLIGCGLAGFSIQEIKPLFVSLEWPKNVIVPLEFSNVKFIKGFNHELKCRGFQFEVGKVFTIENDKPLEFCTNSGFHFCESLSMAHSFYPVGNKSNRFCYIEPIGEIVSDGEKCASKSIKILKELTKDEIDLLSITGYRNSGLFNSGYLNSGYLNSGDRNSGDRNSGCLNSGDRNSGDRNSGYRNSGDRNSGDRNSGCLNSGDRNSGYLNSGYLNSGDRNSGYRNSGDRNSGDLNSGYRNSGDLNSGYLNSGDRNSGDRNSGDRNSGCLNSGDRNSGDLNSGYRNSGVFCNRKRTDSIMVFNKQSGMSWDDWYNHPVYRVCLRLSITKWVSWEAMTDKEKRSYPNAYFQEGYLKVYEYKEAWANLWATLTQEKKDLFKTLPNFDSSIFKDITGIEF